MAARPLVQGAFVALLLFGCASPSHPPVLFEDVTLSAGLNFSYFNGMTGRMRFVEITGGGVATLDYDGDGDSDIYFSQGQNIEPPTDPALRDRLYRNDSEGPGHLRFTEVTGESGLRGTGYGMGVAVGDINNDGLPDLYLTNWGPNQLWRNNGDGTFTDITQDGVSDDPRWSVSAVFSDLDGDGYQDLMVVNYVDYSLENDHSCTSALSGRRDYCGPSAFLPVSDRLLRNRGDGTFEDVSFRSGISSQTSAGLGVTVADFSLDGQPDIYVANDGSDNHLWINQGNGRFLDEAVERGAASNMRGVPEASMGVAAEDFDNDGDPDIFLTHLNGETNTLYTNDGDGYFGDRTRTSGLGPAGIPLTGFGVIARDFDNDGRVDLFVANGDVRILPDQATDPFPLKQPNQMFRNTSEGFVPVNGWRVNLPAEVSRGVAAADFDGDGRIDFVVSNIQGPARLLRNVSSVESEWLGVRLVGPAAEDAAVEVAGRRYLFHRGGSYASSSDLVRVFEVQQVGAISIQVTWPDGVTETLTSAERGRYVTIERRAGS